MKEHLLVAVAWTFFCFFHSWLASPAVKKKWQDRLSTRYKYYRLFYTVFAFATFGVVLLYQCSIRSPYIFPPQIVTYVSGSVIGGAGLLIMGICIKKYFMSLSGVKTLVADHTANDLQVTGIHKYVRHPLYLGTFLFIWGLLIYLPVYSLLISNLIITGYTLLGIRWEEEKLVAEFGNSYEQYKKSVPKVIPSFKQN